MKINLSLAVIAAVAMAVAASPADAASKKKAAKVTVAKSGPYWASNANVCFTNAASWWFPIAVVGTVGCGVFYAIPVAVEGFVVPQGGKA
jgi:hypothetical protein